MNATNVLPLHPSCATRRQHHALRGGAIEDAIPAPIPPSNLTARLQTLVSGITAPNSRSWASARTRAAFHGAVCVHH